MSDDTDVEQLLENFQKALDTLSNIGNVEALITKLDANRNRKLLKKVKHVVSEVHNKVGTIKEKVSKAYKRVKIRSSSESDEVAVADNTDKDVSDKEGDSVDQSEALLNNIDEEGRYSPVIGGKGKLLKKSQRQSENSQNKKESNNSARNSNLSNTESEKSKNKNDETVEEKETSSEKEVEAMDVDSSTSNKEPNSGTSEEQINADKTDPIETEKTPVNEDKEKDDEQESSQEIIEGTPEKPASKISLSLNKNKTKIGDITKLPTLDISNLSFEEKLRENDGSKEKASKNSESKQERPSTDKEKNNNKSDETKEIDTSKKSSKEDQQKNKKKDSDISDDEVDKLKETPKKADSKKNKRGKHDEKHKDASDSDDTEAEGMGEKSLDKTDKPSENKEKNKQKSGEVSSEDEVVTIEDTPKKTSEKKKRDENDGKDSSNKEALEPTEEDKENQTKKLVPKIKLVDISKLLAPNSKLLDINTPSPKAKKSVTFDNSVIILSSSDEETPKKDPKSKDQSPLKSAMRKSSSKGVDNSDSDSKENNENLKNRRHTRQIKSEKKKLNSDHSASDDSDFEDTRKSRRLQRHESKQANLKEKFSKLAVKYGERRSRAVARRLRGDDDKGDKNMRKKNKGNNDKKLHSDSDDDDDSDKEKKELKKSKRSNDKKLHRGESDDEDSVKDKKERKKSKRNNDKKLHSESDDDDDLDRHKKKRKNTKRNNEKKKHRESDDEDSDTDKKERRKSKRDNDKKLHSESDDEDSNKDKNERKKSKRNNDKKLQGGSDDDDSDREKTNVKKRRRKKEILEESSLSEQSDNSDVSDTDFETSSKKRSSRNKRSEQKRAKVSFAEADINDPKLKADVYIRLPLFKCEELPELYKRKKEIFEVKKLTNMDFTRRTRSARKGSSKNSDDSDKPDKKRIKLTLKLKKKEKAKDDSSDDERSSTEENKDDKVDKNDKGKENNKDKSNEDPLEHVDLLDVADDAGINGDLLAEACLEQIKDTSDKEDGDKESEKSDSDEDGKTKEKGENKKNKDKGNKEKESNEKGSGDSEKESTEKDKDEEPTVNGKSSDSEEESNKKDKDDKKDKEDESSDDDDDGKKKKRKNWKDDKLLKQKIDSSDSEDDFAKFSKKKDKANSESVRNARKRMKKTTIILDSDSDGDNDDDNNKKKSSDDDDDYKSEDKNSSDSGSGSEKNEDSEQEAKKPARKRIKRVKDSSSDDEDKSTRKQIRKMIDRDSLSETTKKAEQDEKERKARILEKQKKYNQMFEFKADATVDKVVLDFDEKTDKSLLSVHKKLVKQLKPHQVHGVKFMWDACFESLERAKKDKGSGCILAHCMGLGKTLQVITLVHTLLTNNDKTKVEKILVVCPVNTVLNWKSEFKKWLPKGDEFEVYELVSCKTSSIHHERNYIVREWHENGGVLIIGYNMFRTLSNPDNKTLSKKLRTSFHEGLVDPGPDLVVCDEGHLLKNEKTNLSIAMNRIKTLRRIVLTGTPLQNNLREYWCMVQFIKPNLLGTYKEYMNRFVNPITNGQYTDSTQHDIVVMRRRSHVLHKLLDGVVQRQDYSVLEPYLPPKHEYVLFLKLTEVQVKLYNHYLEYFARKNDGSNRTSFLFKDFQQFQRISTHPRVLSDKCIEDKDKKELNDESDSEGSLKDFIDDDESEAVSTTSSGSDSSVKSDEKKKKKRKTTKRSRVTRAQTAQKRDNDEESDSEVEVLGPKEWWEEYIEKEELDNTNHSAKIFLLFEILKECEEIGDKILVFSQSLYTLNCIEYFLQRIDEATQKGETEKVGGHSGSWAIGLDYFRLDGSSSCDNRASWCDQFNDPDNTRARLFLISTKAGGLGINLVAANRVIIFDVSWNPSHDIQSIYRVYRFGQTKPCYVYRFVTYGAMEMKIYERQVTKQAISKRVIDEQQIDRHYSQTDIQELYKTDLQPTDRPIPLVPKDVLLGEMLQKYDKTIFKYHEHQSLLENKQDEQLNEEERKAAWDEFENEKVIRKTTVTNFAGINMAAFQNSLNFSPQLIQLALGNIVRKDNPTWSDMQIRGILPALVTQLQMQMSENDFSMYNRVQQEIRLMQAIQAQRLRENYLQQYQLQQMLQKQQLTNQMLGNLNITPDELKRLQTAASQNYIQPPHRSTAGGSGDVIELND